MSYESDLLTEELTLSEEIKKERMTRARMRVALGAALLDEERPGWRDEINLMVLRLSDEQQCVLGQLFDERQSIPTWQAAGYKSKQEYVNAQVDFGSSAALAEHYADDPVCVANYELGTKVLGLSDNDAGFHGFDMTDGWLNREDREREPNWNDLDRAWAELLEN